MSYMHAGLALLVQEGFLLSSFWYPYFLAVSVPDAHTKEGGYDLSLSLKRKEKITPFGVNLIRSPVLYRAAQGIAVIPSLHKEYGYTVHTKEGGSEMSIWDWRAFCAQRVCLLKCPGHLGGSQYLS